MLKRCQVSCSERLRMQVSALKTLLESDNNKVRLAMRELDRLKQLLRDKESERAVLERVRKLSPTQSHRRRRSRTVRQPGLFLPEVPLFHRRVLKL